MDFAVTCTPENAPKLADWIATRGGIAVWNSANLSNPGGQWLTPSLDAEGKRVPKPTWQAADEPEMIVVMPERVGVEAISEFKRIRVALRRSSNGLMLKLTDHSQHMVDKALAACEAKHGNAFAERDARDGRPGMAICYVVAETPLLDWLMSEAATK